MRKTREHFSVRIFYNQYIYIPRYENNKLNEEKINKVTNYLTIEKQNENKTNAKKAGVDAYHQHIANRPFSSKKITITVE